MKNFKDWMEEQSLDEGTAAPEAPTKPKTEPSLPKEAEPAKQDPWNPAKPKVVPGPKNKKKDEEEK